jgi:hypothetical protein
VALSNQQTAGWDDDMEETKCESLAKTDAGYYCKLRKSNLPVSEVTQKCLQPDFAVMCVDAYSSLARGQENLDEGSTDAFPWLMDAASHFENLSELDNAINVISIGIKFALKNTLFDKAYSFFCYGRTIYETGVADEDSSITSPQIRQHLVGLGEQIIEAMKKPREAAPLTAVQAELKASIVGGGVNLKKAERNEDDKDLVISHGRSLYEKKAIEYREGADKYFKSSIIGNGVVFACMSALAQLMLGKPKDGMAYLADIAAQDNVRDDFQDHPCFNWTKLVFKAQIERNKDAVVKAHKLFLQIPWSYKDDKEFARRIMESVERRITA